MIVFVFFLFKCSPSKTPEVDSDENMNHQSSAPFYSEDENRFNEESYTSKRSGDPDSSPTIPERDKNDETYEMEVQVKDYIAESIKNTEQDIQKPGQKCVIPEFNPASYGACTMELGFVFDGISCEQIRGCSCQDHCGKFFKTKQECIRICVDGS